jgi:hypothetical protein
MYATSAEIFTALFAGHQVGDYWLQTDQQAREKGLEGAQGRRACAAHVASLTAAKAVSLSLLAVSGRRLAWRRAGVALALDAASHYWADRRQLDPPRGLARLAVATGHRGFWELGSPRPGKDDNQVLGTGAHSMDQAFHLAMLWLAAVAAAS